MPECVDGEDWLQAELGERCWQSQERCGGFDVYDQRQQTYCIYL
jgi:hypothetical protein